MPMQKRRRVERRIVPAIPAPLALAAASLLLVVVLVFHSILVLPPPFDGSAVAELAGTIRLHRPRRLMKHSLILLKNPMRLRRNAVEAFRVASGGGSPVTDLWGSKFSEVYSGCSNASNAFATSEANTLPDRYLMIATSGGLNQQRTGIIDGVVAARILNATLVVPSLDQTSFWKDSSNFSEIFDVDWFIKSLEKDVKIVKEIPENDGKFIRTPHVMRVPRKCSPACYYKEVLPVFMRKHVIQLTKFDYRLSNSLGTDLQKLRCRVNYHGLKFTDQIQKMGDTLVQRMVIKSKHFIALHLRFEPDMLAFSGCYYGGGDKERAELGSIRKRWRTLHISDPEKERQRGKCTLTPEEVGLMLKALGFGNDVHLYVASGEIYGGEETLAPLKELFPNFHTKETLASAEELAPFSSYSSRMAALDFIVCDASDVFVTNNNGNMARILAGRRRYFGHKRTIRPNAKKLHTLFSERTTMTWEAFSSKIRSAQKGFMGEPDEARPGRGEFHEYPSACICESSPMAANSTSCTQTNFDNKDEKRGARQSAGEVAYIHSIYDQLDVDLEYGETTPLDWSSSIGMDLEENDRQKKIQKRKKYSFSLVFKP